MVSVSLSASMLPSREDWLDLSESPGRAFALDGHMVPLHSDGVEISNLQLMVLRMPLEAGGFQDVVGLTFEDPVEVKVDSEGLASVKLLVDEVEGFACDLGAMPAEPGPCDRLVFLAAEQVIALLRCCTLARFYLQCQDDRVMAAEFRSRRKLPWADD